MSLVSIVALGALAKGILVSAAEVPEVRPDILPREKPFAYIVVPAQPDWLVQTVPVCDLLAWLSRSPQCLRKPTYRSRQ